MRLRFGRAKPTPKRRVRRNHPLPAMARVHFPLRGICSANVTPVVTEQVKAARECLPR